MALTLRLSKEESKELEKIKEILGIASASKTIVYLISRYLNNENRLKLTSNRLDETERRLNTLLSLVGSKRDIETKIDDFLENQENI